MLKLNASYSKKVPAETEYSSQSYHASIEVEIPDGLTAEQLQNRIHETFDLVRNSVETELHGGNCTTVQQRPQSPQSYSGGKSAGYFRRVPCRDPFCAESVFLPGQIICCVAEFIWDGGSFVGEAHKVGRSVLNG